VVFTAGATEANALALAPAGDAARSVLCSAIEHESVLAWAGERFSATAAGIVDLDALERRLAAGPRPRILSVMAVNNETGAIQPVAEAAALARAHGIPVHCDAVQAAGRIPLDVAALGVDFLSLSAHKMGGPQGVGALIVRDGATLSPLLKGGGQERRRRAGTENVAGIAGFGAAAEAALADGLADQPRLAALRDRLEAGVLAACPRARVFAAEAPRVANTSCLAMPGVPAETQVMAFDLAGIAVSAGSACSSGKVAASHVLAAMGADRETAGCAVRVSLGWDTRAQDIDRFVAVWQEIAARAGRAAGGAAAA
jgi:cysteine desulfurase